MNSDAPCRRTYSGLGSIQEIQSGLRVRNGLVVPINGGGHNGLRDV